MWNCLHSPLHRCPSQVKGVDSRSTASASWVRIPLCARTSTQVWLKGMDLRSIASASRVRIPSCALFFCKIIVTASPLSPLATHGSTRYLRWRLRGAVPISRRNIRRSPVVRIRRRRTADDVSLPDTADAPHDGEDVCGVDALPTPRCQRQIQIQHFMRLYDWLTEYDIRASCVLRAFSQAGIITRVSPIVQTFRTLSCIRNIIPRICASSPVSKLARRTTIHTVSHPRRRFNRSFLKVSVFSAYARASYTHNPEYGNLSA